MSSIRDFRRSQANYCTYCGEPLCDEHRKANTPNCGNEATWDHVVPREDGKGVGGRHKVVACHDCNTSRGHRIVDDWYQHLETCDYGKTDKGFRILQSRWAKT